MALTDPDKRQLLAEAFDDKRVTFWCARHNYMGPIKGKPEIKPFLGCANCWKIFFISEMATTPPSEREKKLSEIEEVLRNVVQLVEQGKWDFVPYQHAQVNIGEDDDTSLKTPLIIKEV